MRLIVTGPEGRKHTYSRVDDNMFMAGDIVNTFIKARRLKRMILWDETGRSFTYEKETNHEAGT